MANPHVFGIVLAGGEGKRLAPLTADRAKPAVPFGGNYRLIDFALSNLVNAGYFQIVVLTQYKSHSLDRHVAATWRLSPLLGNYVTSVPAQMRHGPRWFAGSADAIYQNLNLIYDERPDYVIVFGADHIYRMDPRQMVEQHIETGAGVTVAGIRAPLAQADQLGVIEPGPDGRSIKRVPREADRRRRAARRARPGVRVDGQLRLHDRDAGGHRHDATRATSESKHDIGGNIIPALVDRGEAYVYDFSQNEVPGATDRDRSYWRDVGTLDAYYDAHMDIVSVDPIFNLYNSAWPILTWLEALPPAKFVFEEDGRIGHALELAHLRRRHRVGRHRAPLGRLAGRARWRSRSLIEGSIVLHGVEVGPRAIVRNAIVDKNVRIASGRADRRRPRARPRALRRLARWDRRDRQGRDGGGLSCASPC